MTEKQAEAEIHCRLAKFLLFRLQEECILTPEESEKARQALCKKYKPFTYSLEVDQLYHPGPYIAPRSCLGCRLHTRRERSDRRH